MWALEAPLACHSHWFLTYAFKVYDRRVLTNQTQEQKYGHDSGATPLKTQYYVQQVYTLNILNDSPVTLW